MSPLAGTFEDLAYGPERLCCGSREAEEHQEDCTRRPAHPVAYETSLHEKLAAVVRAEAGVTNAQNVLKHAMADFTRAAELEANRT